MKIYLQSCFDALIIYDSHKLKISKLDCFEIFNFKFDSSMLILPKEGNAYSISIQQKHGEVTCGDINIELYKIADCDFLIKLISPTFNLLINYEKSKKRKNGDCKIVVFGNNPQMLCVYDDGKLKFQKLIEGMYNSYYFEIKKYKQGDYVWFEAVGDAKSFLYIADDIGMPIFCDYYHEKNLSENTMKILKFLNDGVGHGQVCNYDLENFCLKEVHSVFIEKRELLGDFELAYLFLESVKAKNFGLAKSYLSNAICDNLSKEKLLAFFGEFDAIEQCNYYQNENQICAINTTKKIIDVYTFQFENKKIINIEKK